MKIKTDKLKKNILNMYGLITESVRLAGSVSKSARSR